MNKCSHCHKGITDDKNFKSFYQCDDCRDIFCLDCSHNNRLKYNLLCCKCKIKHYKQCIVKLEEMLKTL